MSETGDKIECPKCKSSNFPSSAVCWQCGQPLSGPKTENVQPGAPTPPPQPSPPGFAPPPSYAPPANDNSTLLIVLGFVCAALGIICCPIFPIVGIILGVILNRRQNQLGVWVIAACALFLVVGVVISIAMGAMYMRMMPEIMKHGGMPNPYIPTPK